MWRVSWLGRVRAVLAKRSVLGEESNEQSPKIINYEENLRTEATDG